jgi:hypothetical protein
LAWSVQPLGGEAEPVQARSSPLEVVHGAQGGIGVGDAAHIDNRPRQTCTRYAVDDGQVAGFEWLDPMLDDVNSSNPSA